MRKFQVLGSKKNVPPIVFVPHPSGDTPRKMKLYAGTRSSPPPPLGQPLACSTTPHVLFRVGSCSLGMPGRTDNKLRLVPYALLVPTGTSWRWPVCVMGLFSRWGLVMPWSGVPHLVARRTMSPSRAP